MMITMMNNHNVLVLLLVVVTTVTFTNAFTPITPISSCTSNYVSTKLNGGGRDLSGLTTDELRRMALNKGYDTEGMDREGLESIAGGWSSKQFAPSLQVQSTQQQQQQQQQLPQLRPAGMNTIPSSRTNNYRNYSNNNGSSSNSSSSTSPYKTEIGYYYDTGTTPTIFQQEQKQQEQQEWGLGQQARQKRMQNRQKMQQLQQQQQMQQQQMRQQQQMQQQQMRQQQQLRNGIPNNTGTGSSYNIGNDYMPSNGYMPPNNAYLPPSNLNNNINNNNFSNTKNNNNNVSKNNNPYTNTNFFNTRQKSTTTTTTTTRSDLFQKLEQPVKSFGVGFASSFIATSPFTYAHHMFFPAEIITNANAQLCFDTLTGAIAAGAFATVYRYFVRENDGRPKDDFLTNGVILAFAIARTLSRIRVTYYCQGFYCGEPLGFLDWAMLIQTTIGLIESIACFGAAALVVEFCVDRGFIARGER